jgi:hypothetical protein
MPSDETDARIRAALRALAEGAPSDRVAATSAQLPRLADQHGAGLSVGHRGRSIVLATFSVVFVGVLVAAVALDRSPAHSRTSPGQSTSPHVSAPSTLPATTTGNTPGGVVVELNMVACWSVQDCVLAGAGALFGTSDGGRTWVLERMPKALADERLEFDGITCPSVGACVAVGWGGLIVKTDNGGRTWAQASPRRWPVVDDYFEVSYLGSVSCPSVMVCYAVGSGGKSDGPLIVSTTDGGTGWTVRTLPSISQAETIACTSTNVCLVFGIAPDLIVLRTTDAGDSWDTDGVPGAGSNVSSASCPSAQDCFAVYQGGVITTTDGGMTWLLHAIPNSAGLGISCPTSKNCVAGGFTGNDQALVMTTSNGGATWVASRRVPPSLQRVSGVYCTTTEICVAVGWGSPNSSVITSSDGGITWVPHGLPGQW